VLAASACRRRPKRLRNTDRARAMYVRYYCKRDWSDGRLYDLVIDSMRLSHAACVEIVLQATFDPHQ
jgi:cytidylate kinase